MNLHMHLSLRYLVSDTDFENHLLSALVLQFSTTYVQTDQQKPCQTRFAYTDFMIFFSCVPFVHGSVILCSFCFFVHNTTLLLDIELPQHVVPQSAMNCAHAGHSLCGVHCHIIKTVISLLSCLESL